MQSSIRQRSPRFVGIANEVAGPGVIAMDMKMPNEDGVDACREIIELLLDTRELIPRPW